MAAGITSWLGAPPERCDICHERIKDEFVDGRTVRGPWGILCPKCHPRYGVGEGTGRGQRYRRLEPNGRFIKQPYPEAPRPSTSLEKMTKTQGRSRRKGDRREKRTHEVE